MKKPFLTAKTAFFTLFTIVFSGAFLSTYAAEEQGHSAEPFDANKVIIHHVLDDHIWHLWDGHYGTIYLPIIAYTSQGLKVFSSHHFYDEHHQATLTYEGLKMEGHHIVETSSGEAVLDLSITKNVAMLFINATLLLLVLSSVGRAYKRNAGKAPRGLQSFMEPIILFVRDEIVKPNISHHHERYLPYLLSLFFFILFGNLLGLLPGAGNLTGNIAVTAVLAVLTFLITNFSGNKAYWTHIFWTPGLPLILRPFILPVEIIGIFTKPISLTVRLFVAITAGHIVLLSLISLAFIFQSVTVGFMSSLVVLFISLIELLVAGIQAYVFTLFTALYIGMATEQHDHH